MAGVEAGRDLIGNQTEHEVDSLVEVLLGHLVAQRSTAMRAQEVGENPGELLVLREDHRSGRSLHEV